MKGHGMCSSSIWPVHIFVVRIGLSTSTSRTSSGSVRQRNTLLNFSLSLISIRYVYDHDEVRRDY